MVEYISDISFFNLGVFIPPPVFVWYSEILEDDSINCVVELMGGVTHAQDVVFQALRKGKHVITANKALLAQFLPEVHTQRFENICA